MTDDAGFYTPVKFHNTIGARCCTAGPLRGKDTALHHACVLVHADYAGFTVCLVPSPCTFRKLQAS